MKKSHIFCFLILIIAFVSSFIFLFNNVFLKKSNTVNILYSLSEIAKEKENVSLDVNILDNQTLNISEELEEKQENTVIDNTIEDTITTIDDKLDIVVSDYKIQYEETTTNIVDTTQNNEETSTTIINDIVIDGRLINGKTPYVVIIWGDTLNDLSNKLNIPVDVLAEYNNIENKDLIITGHTIYLPPEYLLQYITN